MLIDNIQLVTHSVNYAIRSGIAITSGYAITQCTRLVKSVRGAEREELAGLQARLASKISIISPPIDMIELIAARGNTSLESALTLTKQIRLDIQDLGVRLSQAGTDDERIRRKMPNAKSPEQMSLDLSLIISEMKRVLARIEDAVPLLMLAITTSGANLSTALPTTVSPSRLLQASTFLSAGDANYAAMPGQPVQVGPVFVLSLYMLFAAHAFRPHDDEGVPEFTWKEVIRKAKVKLMRVSLDQLYDLPSQATHRPAGVTNASTSPVDGQTPSDIPSQGRAYEFAYQLVIVEDFDDDRVHEDEGEPYEEVARAGIREVFPIHEVSKIFYADTGKILKIGADGEPNNPILLLKRDVNAPPPRRMVQRQPLDAEDILPADEHRNNKTEGHSPEEDSTPLGAGVSSPGHDFKPNVKSRFPPDLDPEWMAFEVYTEAPDSENEDPELSVLEVSSPPAPVRRSSDFLTSALSGLRLRNSPTPTPTSPPSGTDLKASQLVPIPQSQSPVPIFVPQGSTLPALRTSLSLLELLVRLTALQQFQQASHLTINDEFLNFFLSGSSSTGAGADSEYRKNVRREARRRVGFDPYDESPIKPRGEEYIDQYGSQYQDRWEHDYEYEGGHDNGEWDYTTGRSSPNLRSPTSASPSPSVRQHMQDRLRKSSSTKSASGAPVTPQGMPKDRADGLRQVQAHKKSPLGRSESDSTLGTSPGTVGDQTKEGSRMKSTRFI